VFRSAEDPNDVVVLQDVSDVAKARTWVASADMKTAMQTSGVIGSPNVRFALRRCSEDNSPGHYV
jgi:hypothetical protein